jgi:Protein of unknown function (DUF2000)
MSNEQDSIAEKPSDSQVMRLAVVLHPTLESGAAANVAAIVVGGLQCEAFEAALPDADRHLHAAIRWNLVVLKARSAPQLQKLVASAAESSVLAVAFTSKGQELSNSFDQYKDEISLHHTNDLNLVAVAVYGGDDAVRSLTRPFSLFK